ncbi:MAG: hypothetical protein Q8Q03_03075 [bacterium]|nr:hypothetical protein [bacterium]
MKSLFKLSIVTLFIFLLPLLSIHAQIPSSLDGVEISASPAIPNPGQEVRISLESYSTDLNSASITWIVNGKSYASGTGLLFINITAPSIGKGTDITASIRTTEGREVRKSVSLKSGSVDMIWESDGYVPPFYKGKSSFAYENALRIVAVPHLSANGNSEIDPKTLVYKWKKNDKVILDQSGYGRYTLLVKEEIPRPIDIEVEVSTKDGSRKAVSSIRLEPGDPSISFYEESPLYGVMYNKSIINRVRLSNQEITIRAVPYTFSPSTLGYLWSINNLERKDLSTNQSITLRTKGDSEGSSSIALEIRSAKNILQGARSAVSVSFSKRNEDNSVKF